MTRNIRALLFGLSEDLASDLIAPLKSCAVNVLGIHGHDGAVNEDAQIIFCGADTGLVSRLRDAAPEAPIVVVSRHPEVSDWLDSIEAGATDYCAAPFEPSQLRWIMQASMGARAAA